MVKSTYMISRGEKMYEDYEGERTVYRKGNRIVNVFHPPGDDGFYLLEARENK
ncbi:hypothetical protein ABET23_17460 [Bacillus wiedmannii]|uniref:hypothetical protein n=1 Tax=Bacillus wiedmannii TaxID=1890302 RepID=UPI003D22F50A